MAKFNHQLLPTISWIGSKIRFEASSKCQLKCPLCITGTGYNREHSSVGWGHLKFENFEKLILKNPRIREIELSNYGEILLNPELPRNVGISPSKKYSLISHQWCKSQSPPRPIGRRPGKISIL